MRSATARSLGRTLEAAAPAFATTVARRIAAAGFGIRPVAVRAFPYAAECDQLFHLCAADGAGFSLRISNPAQDLDVLDFQNQALNHACQADPDMPVPRVMKTLAGQSIYMHQDGGNAYAVRLLTYLPGSPILGVMTSAALRRNIGRALARFDRAMRGFRHPGANPNVIWDIRNAPRVWRLGFDIRDDRLARLMDAAFARFTDNIAPALDGLRTQVIHNDLNPKNLLVDAENPDTVTGIIDFGDMIDGPLVFDPAVALSKLLLDLVDMRAIQGVDPVAFASDLVTGYTETLPLDSAEIGLLLDLCIVRLAMRVAIRVWRAKRNVQQPLDPGILTSGAAVLDCLLGLDRQVVAARLQRAAIH